MLRRNEGILNATLTLILEEIEVDGEGGDEHEQAEVLVGVAVGELNCEGIGVGEHLAFEAAPLLGGARNLGILCVFGDI